MSSLNVLKGDIDHTSLVAKNIGLLYTTSEYSDITIVVEGKSYAVHKIVLAARSEYFRALLFGGMKETAQTEIVLQSGSSKIFDVLLKYIYTGRVSLNNLKEEVLIEILGMCHEFGFVELETSIGEYLKEILQVRNVCLIFDSSRLYQMQMLYNVCLTFIETHSTDVIRHETFSNLSVEAVCDILVRDSFSAPEVDIFRAVHNWYIANPNEDFKPILKNLRLPLMSIEDLLEVVRPTGLIQCSELLDAIQTITTATTTIRYRGSLLPEVNVATAALGAMVIEGDMRTALLDGNNDGYDMERGYTRHSIGECSDKCITIRLGCQAIINHFKMLLWDKDLRSYSYYIEVSVNKIDWVRAVDHTNYCCRSWQNLYFPEQVVQYIRIVGTNNTVNRVFHVVSFEAMYTHNVEKIENGLIKPKTNVATLEKSAIMIEGVSRSRDNLINGNVSNYDWDLGYTCHQLGSGHIMVQLGQPYLIGSFRLLLWDLDNRHYSYYIETSVNGTKWDMAVDRRSKQCTSWQNLKFTPRPVVFIKIVGTRNSANEAFHCVHLECPANPNILLDEIDITDEPDSSEQT